MVSNKPIGQLNGRWALLLKVALGTYPVILAAAITWSVWVTANIFELRAFAQQGPRWTAKDAELQTAVVKEWVEDKFRNEVPPKPVTERLVRLERIADETQRSVQCNSVSLASLTTSIQAMMGEYKR
jgi:hypothetical protein